MAGNNGNDPQRKIEAGEVEKVKASEEVIRRNVVSMMMHGNDTRKALIELKTMFDALQGNVLRMNNEMKQMRSQLSVLQGEFYKRGTTSYSDTPEEEAAEETPERSQGEDASDKRISFP